MNLPDEQQWFRVEQLAEELELLPPERVRTRLSELALSGEPSVVLTMLRRWLALPPAPASLEAGTLVAGRYTLREQIGEGGMGVVWRARQESVGRDVALKMIHPALVNSTLHTRLVKEIEFLGLLDHPGIVKIFDAGVHHQAELEPIPFFAMELVTGQPIHRWAAKHRSDRAALLQVAADVCSAVQSAHERRIVHRDLKPANILVKEGGQPVVLDFGIARLAGLAGHADTGLFSGTLQYAAPEQHLGRDTDFRSGESVDVYALGLVLFEMLSGRKPLDFPNGASIAEIRRAVLEQPLPRLSEVLPDSSPLLNEIVARALRRNPADRFYSVAAFGRAIQRAASLENAAVPPPTWTPSAGAMVPGTGWRLVKKLGEGGVGEVWIGMHDQLSERRVFKFCDTEEKARTLKRELTLFRLLKERVGRNPHFLQLHEVSLDEPPWYLMMDYTDARDLPTWCAEHPGGIAAIPESVRLEIGAQLGESLQAAHEAGILHRDVKPANVLVQATGGQLHVLIADFGIGQITTEALLGGSTRLGFTRTVSDLKRSTLSGTMLYLAPEVLEGGEATARSDIYSLGVLLWQLCVGDFRVALDPVDWPSRIHDSLLRQDLLRCLSARPDKRWTTAQELASSLRALPQRRAAERQRQAELAGRERAAYRRGVLRTSALALAVVAILGWLAWFGWERSVEAERQRRAASLARTRTALGELQAMADLKSGHARAKLFAQMPVLTDRDPQLEMPLRESAIRILALPVFEQLDEVPFPPGPAGWVADRGERMIRQKPQGGLEVMDLSAEPPEVVALAGFDGPVARLRLNVNGLAAGAISEDGNLRLWFGSRLTNTYIIPGPVYAGCFAFPPTTLSKSKSLPAAVARSDSVEIHLLGRTNAPLVLRRRSSETEDHFPESTSATLIDFALFQEGVLAVAGPGSGNVLFWKIADQSNGRIEGELASAAWHPDKVACLKWNPVADEIATGARDGIVRIWRFAFTGTVPQTAPLRRIDLAEPIRDLAWSPDGNLLGVLLDSGAIRVFLPAAPDKAVASLHYSGATSLAFISGGTLMAWGAEGHAAWGAREAPFFNERAVSAAEAHVDFQQDGTLTATASERTEFLNPSTLAWTAGFKAESLYASVWEAATFFFHLENRWRTAKVTRESASALRLPKTFGTVEEVRRIVSSPHGSRTAWVYTNELICHRAGLQEGQAAPIVAPPVSLAVSDAIPSSAWSDEAGNIHLYDHAHGTSRNLPRVTDILWLVFAPGTNVLACRTRAGITFVNPLTGQRAACDLMAPGASPTPLAFSADGRWMATSASDHALIITPMPPARLCWQDDGAPLANILAQAIRLRSASTRRMVSLDWNASGSRLAMGTADGFVQTWNMSLLREKLRLWKLDWGADPPPAERAFVPIRLN